MPGHVGQKPQHCSYEPATVTAPIGTGYGASIDLSIRSAKFTKKYGKIRITDVDVEVVAITGHKDLKMLQRYTHLRAEDLARKLRTFQKL